MRTIYCVECESEKKCLMIKGDRAYPHRPDLFYKNFWQCPDCSNFVGTHNKGESTKPLGCIPNKPMKKVRQQIHAVLDPIWMNKKMSRFAVYKKVSESLGYEFHTAEIKTLDAAEKIYSLVKGIF